MCHVKNDNFAFLAFWRYPPLLYLTDQPLVSCLLCKSKTLWNIFMILGRNVEQDHTMCRVQE